MSGLTCGVGDRWRRLAEEDAAAGGEDAGGRRVGEREEALCFAHVHVGVLDVAADQEVLDRAADRDGGIEGIAIGPQRLAMPLALIVTLSMPRPNEMLRAPEGATRRTFLVWPPM